ncbi:transglycosylase SLT domain-containing protein [Streptomyces sp. UH6]|uniref:transglycosylase SLT domain-containing protein n=1 Tax=Streptomyces sp. UH6 TaxID=2748379 RepID=UPI0015D477CF|nr:transglycosylase SLT domain-containing protein [Streptomyces sp. UH6]NYV76645.1 transglycosylase SLT domain-containing protein [Streptomyces sp. UH6]
MPKFNLSAYRTAVTKKQMQKVGIAGAGALSAAALAFTVVPASAETATDEAVQAQPVVYSAGQIQNVKAGIADQAAGASVKAEAVAAQQAEQKAEEKKAADEAAAKKAAAEKAAKERQEKEASRSAARPVAKKAETKKVYANNLDGWIREALDIMDKNDIPGSYHGLYKNIIRESSGNPKAINLWDINAQNGIPSKGLLQVIPPTFETYHVKGTPDDIYHPVANIVAAANYAADRYGTIDNVNSAY